MKVETSKLSGRALDWAVATIRGLPIQRDPMGFGPGVLEGGFWVWDCENPSSKPTYQLIGRHYSPSTKPEQGWPIVEEVGIDIRQIKRRLHGLYEYRADRAAWPGAEIVARELHCGPGRFVKLPEKPGKNQGKWLARLSLGHHPFGWTEKDFLSDTGLVAAMRCYVASERGREIDIPSILMKETP
jgi:hypothetical protein